MSASLTPSWNASRVRHTVNSIDVAGAAALIFSTSAGSNGCRVTMWKCCGFATKELVRRSASPRAKTVCLFHVHAHAACRAFDGPHGRFDGEAVEVGHLDLGDLLH